MTEIEQSANEIVSDIFKHCLGEAEQSEAVATHGATTYNAGLAPYVQRIVELVESNLAPIIEEAEATTGLANFRERCSFGGVARKIWPPSPAVPKMGDLL